MSAIVSVSLYGEWPPLLACLCVSVTSRAYTVETGYKNSVGSRKTCSYNRYVLISGVLISGVLITGFYCI